MYEILYKGRMVFRFIHIIIFSFLFSLVFLMIALFENLSFILVSIIFLLVSSYFLYLSLPGDIIISNNELLLKKKFHKAKKIFDLYKIHELNEITYEYKKTLFSTLFDLFSSMNFISIYNDSISCVLEISDIDLITYRIYSYQTIHSYNFV